MIRIVRPQDAETIASIYNEYVAHSTATFDTHLVTEREMRKRIARLSTQYPYFVCEAEGRIAGYCYAHPWKEKPAYAHTWETTVYLSAAYAGQGLGRSLMQTLIEECRRRGCRVLIACITEGNEASCALHERLGFRQVSSRFEQVGLKFGRWLDVVDYQLTLDV